MLFDIFLGGPWQRYAHEQYKHLIKEAFPDMNFFDPEEQKSQVSGGWPQQNRDALRSSRSLLAYAPGFPMPGVAYEIGMFYEMNAPEVAGPLEQLVIIWPEFVKPDFGKQVAKNMGYIVENTSAAITHLKKVLG